MLHNLNGYTGPIFQACLVFPFIAMIFTLPFLIHNYRKFGGIAVMRVLVVYSLILYQLCAFLLTVLPLPSRSAVAAMKPRPIGWVPFTDLTLGLTKFGMDWHSPGTLLNVAGWKAYLTSHDFFQIVANIVMQMPLGFYLRYYFRRSWKQAVLIGLGVSLFYELTQLTGLWFIYPQAYRYASVDDLINNTLGCLLGFWFAPLVTWLLPSREEIDRISYTKGQQITLMRRMAAAVIDGIVFGTLFLGGAWFLPTTDAVPLPRAGILWFAVYYAVFPWLTRGRTVGHLLLRLRVVREDGERPSLWRLLIRYGLLYMVEPMLLYSAMFLLLAILLALIMEGQSLVTRLILVGFGLLGLAVCLYFPLRCWIRWKTFPHGHYSHTKVAQEAAKGNAVQRLGDEEATKEAIEETAEEATGEGSR